MSLVPLVLNSDPRLAAVYIYISIECVRIDPRLFINHWTPDCVVYFAKSLSSCFFLHGGERRGLSVPLPVGGVRVVGLLVSECGGEAGNLDSRAAAPDGGPSN